jgi:two-component system NtrC family sensor kinase
MRNLVDFSRKSSGERTWENLGELVEGSVSLVEPEARGCGIRLEQTLGRNLPTMHINGNEIQQVLVNILKNGIAAMPGGGTLGVRLSRRDQMATIEIRDTGTGIDQANLPRIFEPFFTTKEVGKGTGLGLSISYRIVKDHGGNITVSSTVGEGSTFVIELPVDAADVESARAAGPTAGGKEHQLLVASDAGQEVKAQDE